MANHPLIKDVKKWIVDSFSFMDAVGYDVVFNDDVYGMENTKAIYADIDGLTDYDYEKGKENLLKSVPKKIKVEFPYIRISVTKDGGYFIMYITLLDNNDYLEKKNISYINLNESKKSARKSLRESRKIGYIRKTEYEINNRNYSISDNAKLFRIIDDLDSKGFAFKYESEWISKDICKHFLAEDDKVKVDLYK